jgi:prefoldin beta subunit
MQLTSDENMQYAQAKYRELVGKIESLRTQITTLELDLRSIDEALRKLEKIESDTEVYERAGHVFIKRNKEELIADLRSRKELTETLLEKYKKEESEARKELKQLLENLGLV